MADDPYIYHLGGNWGDSILIQKDDDYNERNAQQKVYGWKNRIPKVGDILMVHITSGLSPWKFIEVKPCNNPTDMFFGVIEYQGPTVEGA